MSTEKKVAFSKNPSKEEPPKPSSSSITPSSLSTYPPLKPLLLKKQQHNQLFSSNKDGNNFLRYNRWRLAPKRIKTLKLCLSCTQNQAQSSIMFTVKVILLWCPSSKEWSCKIFLIIPSLLKERWWWRIMWKSIVMTLPQYLIIRFSPYNNTTDKCIIQMITRMFSSGKTGHTHWTKPFCSTKWCKINGIPYNNQDPC